MVGIFVVAILGNAAEHATAVTAALFYFVPGRTPQ
jgi:Ca2+/H+ antiporter